MNMMDDDYVSEAEGVELENKALEHAELASAHEDELFRRECEQPPEHWASAREKEIARLQAVTNDYRILRLSDPLISQAAAARVLCVHPTRVRELIEQGKLVQLRFPAIGVIGVTIASLDAYLLRRRKLGLSDAASCLRQLKRWKP